MKWTLVTLLVLVAAENDAGKKDLDAMQGEWACERFVRDGMVFDDDTAGSLFRTVKGNGYTIYRFRKAVSKGTLTLDATKSPRQIDLTPGEGPAKGKVAPGIYKLEGDTFTVCYAFAADSRPGVFESKKDSGMLLIVARRQP